MVICPKGTRSQIKANAEAFERHNHPSLFSFDSSLSWIYSPLEGQLEFEGEIEGSLGRFEYDEIRADKRSPPNVEDEVVYLFVAHFLDIIKKHWEAQPCLKPTAENPTEEISVISQKSQNSVTYDDLEEMYKKRSETLSQEIIKENIEQKISEISHKRELGYQKREEEKEREEANLEEIEWKIFIPDEEVYLILLNGAWYRGRVSRRLMEGLGIYFWEDGATYEGEFIGGTATGLGRLTFPDLSVYEGAVYKSYRHGEGLQCMFETPVMYSGEWWLGKKHGHGLIVYDEPSNGINFYKGNWENGYKEGFGFRHYPSGAKYIGFWKKGKRHGNGVMMWTNNDTYKGQWENGLMHGYGEYTWNGFKNKSLSYPAANVYRGNWAYGKRNGSGNLETMNGVIIETVWKDGIKNGCGAVVCNDGSVVVSDNLFKNDKQGIFNNEEDETGLLVRNQIRSSIKTKNSSHNNRRGADDNRLIAFLTSYEKAKAVSIRIYSPPHKIELTPYLKKIAAQRPKFNCGNHETGNNEFCSQKCPGKNSNDLNEYLEKEEKFLHNGLVMYMCQLKSLYNEYATIACEPQPYYNCTLIRLFLWQMLVDCQVHDRMFTLVDFGNLIAQEEHLLMEKPHDPFEKIHFWQFLQILIVLSWNLYGQYVYAQFNIYCHETVEGFMQYYELHHEKFALTRAFHYFLENDLFGEKTKSNSALSIANIKNIAPLEAMYFIYRNFGEPHSAREFLIKTCMKKDNLIEEPLIVQYFEKLPFYKIEKNNLISITGQVTYTSNETMLKDPELFVCENASFCEAKTRFTCFQRLRPKDIISCLAEVCPGIVVDDLIVNIEYQLTFLEFCQVIILCTEFALKKEAMEQIRSEIISRYKADLQEYEKKLQEYEKQKGNTTKKGSSSFTSKKGRK